MVVDVYGTYSGRRSCIQNVTGLEREILRYVGYQLVDTIEHIARASLLNGVAVDVEMEVQGSEAAIDELVTFLAGRRFVQITGMDVRKLDVVEEERKFGID